jgi:hypothetical protein
MRIATLGPYFAEGIRQAGHECIIVEDTPNARVFLSSVDDRLAHGRRLVEALQSARPDLLLDSHGSGMLFLEAPAAEGPIVLLHEQLGIPLVSAWPESYRVYFKNVDPVILRRALMSPTWFKGMVARSHLAEARWLRIPNCFHLWIGAQEADYPQDPADVDWDGPAVLFAGSQQSRYFAHEDGVDVRNQRTGVLASAATMDGSAASFLECYQRYGRGERPANDHDYHEQAACVSAYYEDKLFFSAWRNVTLRDRFVLRLSQHLGSRFVLSGHRRWHDMYGLPVQPRTSYEEYLQRLRRTPICINMSNGDNATGLNVRHYEITAQGGFLLAFDTPELHDHFDVGREIETFRNEPELLAKIDYYLGHTRARNAVARAGQKRILRDHLMRYRIASIVDHVTRHQTPARA